MGRFILILSLSALAGCGRVPADIAGTEQRLRDGDTLAIGLVAAPAERSEAVALARSGAAALDMSHRLENGAAETLLPALAEGEVDLVVGRFARRSPWAKDVLLSRAIGGEPVSGEEPAWRFATRNGENRWAMTVDALADDPPARAAAAAR